MATTRLLTYDDLCAMPEDGQRRELIGGSLFVSPSPNRKHQKLVVRLTVWLGRGVAERGLGEVYVAPMDTKLSLHDVVQPDLLVVLNKHTHRSGPAAIEYPPDLVIEVLSPSTRATDEAAKRRLYEMVGVPEYVMVDSDAEQVRWLVLRHGHYQEMMPVGSLFRSQVIPGLEVDAVALFAGLD